MYNIFSKYVARLVEPLKIIKSNNNKRATDLRILLDRTPIFRKLNPTFDKNNGEPVLVIKSLIDKIDIDNILTMCEYVKFYHPKQLLSRDFKKLVVNYFGDEMVEAEVDLTIYDGGGNTAVFMEGHMQELMPTLLDHVMKSISEAAVLANWHPYPRQLGIRCIESLSYFNGGELSMHTDSDSIFTIVIMLSDPTALDFTGGDFLIKHDNTSIKISLNQGEAIMFDSNSLHGVESITTGQRNVLVLELWAYDDSVKGDCRPSVSKFKGRHKIPVFLRSPK